MDTKLDFLYLSEPDTLAAGVNDIQACIDVCEEVFTLLAQGDYLMGGSNHNSHGLGLVFPQETRFPNMPTAGPDRRFVAMPAYLGGRFDVCGNKWYGSNAANKAKDLPRSILTVILNHKDTGAPLCLMSANLLSAARTGAIPAVAVRHLSRQDAEVLAVIGCGPINRACTENILTQAPNIRKVICCNNSPAAAVKLAAYLQSKYQLDAVTSEDLAETVRSSDIVSIAASRTKPLKMAYAWLKKGATVLLSGPAQGDDDFWTRSTIVYDHIGLHQAYVSEAIESGDQAKYYSGVIGGPIYSLIDQGRLPALTDEKSKSIGQIILGDKSGRQSADEIIIFVACGMAVFDIAWGYDVYQQALKKNIGQQLLLWDKPALG